MSHYSCTLSSLNPGEGFARAAHVSDLRAGQSLKQPLHSVFERFSKAASEWSGRTSAFVWAVGIVLVWALVGPLFHFSDAWQLVINSLTNIVTFLMVFLIQRSQNKDTLALQLKVNELIAVQRGAHNALIAIDRLSEDELRELQTRFARLAELGVRGHAMSVLDIVDAPVDVSRNETE